MSGNNILGKSAKTKIRKSLRCNGLRFFFSDHERVKQIFGPQEVDQAVEADKQREQAEKARKRPRRSLDRGGR